MCTPPRGERPPPRFAIVGGDDDQTKRAEAERRGLDRRFVLLLDDPHRAHGLAPGGTYAVVSPLLDRDHEILSILRRSGWQQFDDCPRGRVHVEASTPDDPARLSVGWIALHTGDPGEGPQAEWTEWRVLAGDEPLTYHYTPDAPDDDGRTYTMDLAGTVEITVPGSPALRDHLRQARRERGGMTMGDLHEVERLLIEQQRDPGRRWSPAEAELIEQAARMFPERGGSTAPASPAPVDSNPHLAALAAWADAPTEPVEYHREGDDPRRGGTPWADTVAAAIAHGQWWAADEIRTGDRVHVEGPDGSSSSHTVTHVAGRAPGEVHLSTDASRSAYAAAGRLRDAGEHRDDDLAWPEEWTWGGTAGPVAALVDEDQIESMVRYGGWDREQVEAHAPVYAPGTVPDDSDEDFVPLRQNRWLPDPVELTRAMAANRAALVAALTSTGSAFAGMREDMLVIARAMADVLDAPLRGGMTGEPLGIRGGSPSYVVIDEVHEWVHRPHPRVSDVVDTSSLAPARPLDPQPSVEPTVRVSAPLDVDPEVVAALRRGDTIDLSDRRPQAARFSPRLPPGSLLDVRWRR